VHAEGEQILWHEVDSHCDGQHAAHLQSWIVINAVVGCGGLDEDEVEEEEEEEDGDRWGAKKGGLVMIVMVLRTSTKKGMRQHMTIPHCSPPLLRESTTEAMM
jgi:hypothetical protein